MELLKHSNFQTMWKLQIVKNKAKKSLGVELHQHWILSASIIFILDIIGHTDFNLKFLWVKIQVTKTIFALSYAI